MGAREQGHPVGRVALGGVQLELPVAQLHPPRHGQALDLTKASGPGRTT